MSQADSVQDCCGLFGQNGTTGIGDIVSLTREALDKWYEYAKRDLESAPADGMLVYLIDKKAGDSFTRAEVEIIAVAYLKAMQAYVRP